MSLKRRISWIIHSADRLDTVIRLDDHTDNLRWRTIIRILLIPAALVNLLKLMAVREPKHFQYQLGIVSIVKNEAPYMAEWICYHLSAGVDHIFLYDNDSTDDLQDVLRSFGERVTLIPIHGVVRQLDAYNHALNHYGLACRFMAFIDADEFIYSPEGDHEVKPVIEDILDRPHVGGLAVNWLIYGSSHFEHQPAGLVTDNFVLRSRFDFTKNLLIKTICNPRRVFYFSLSHAPNYLPGYHAVNELGTVVPWATTKEYSGKRIRLNHYYSKSREAFLKKRARGSGEVIAPRRIEEFKEHDKNDVLDASMRDYNALHHLS
ncbi:glycosyltransferase family 2 protein [Lacticaseibacillus sp. 866-1]|uniref:glycosyltransferase family 2 protein n=1 Tax=Lacticaseibacillus sp. 866-1 TaxID=2799576 RepID=UPI0019431953|nr:glycosyltransferase family 2 protein [Lacticaseibacillus sp. 866-1]